jgi:hypothetical protein
MAEYLVGQIIQLKDVISSDVAGLSPVDDSTDAVTVYQPDGTTAVPSPVTHGALNSVIYTAMFTPTMTGWHEYVWTSSSTGAGKGRGRFWVSPVP